MELILPSRSIDRHWLNCTEDAFDLVIDKWKDSKQRFVGLTI